MKECLREYDNTFTMDMNLYLQFDRLFLRSLCCEGSVLKGLGGGFFSERLLISGQSETFKQLK